MGNRLRLGLALGLAAACIPSEHRLDPYREDAARAARLEDRAEAACRARRSTPPVQTFTTDGCSMSPDGDWISCCLEHDIEYWCGGPSEARRQADTGFRACLGRGHGVLMASAMYWRAHRRASLDALPLALGLRLAMAFGRRHVGTLSRSRSLRWRNRTVDTGATQAAPAREESA